MADSLFSRIDSPHRMRNWQIAVAVFLCALILRLACFTGITAEDDLHYSRQAQRIAAGDFTPTPTHWTTRYGTVAPVALAYALVGVRESTTIVVPLVASSMAVALVALIGLRLFNERAAVIAALLAATFPIELRYATILVPEPVLNCIVLLAVFAYVSGFHRPTFGRGAVTGAFIGIAYLSKEPALFIAPALMIDAAFRKNWRTALGIALGALAIVAVEIGSFYAGTGDPLYRVHAMAFHNSHLPSDVALIEQERLAAGTLPVDPVESPFPLHVEEEIETDPDAARRWMMYRLFRSYPRRMLMPQADFGVHSIVALFIAAAAVIRYRHDRRVWLLMLLSSIPWLYLNFGSSSLNSYVPIPPVLRYIAFLYPPLFLLAGWIVADLTAAAGWTKRVAYAGLAVVAVIGFATGLLTRARDYHTEHVAVLRVIAKEMMIERVPSLCVETDPVTRARWRGTLSIMMRGRLPRCRPGAGVVLRAGALGLPYAASNTEPAAVPSGPP